MSIKVDNAIIMAAGISSRFAPLSFETHKALITVRGEVLIERQIQQLKEAGIQQIIVVIGYKKKLFEYLKKKYNVVLIENPDYKNCNNYSSLYAARSYLKNSYICCSDNYFTENPFTSVVEQPYYASVYIDGKTSEWCISTAESGVITGASVGGENSWIMLGHAFFSEKFSIELIKIVAQGYNSIEIKNKLWETIYIENIDKLKLWIRKYNRTAIFEFDNLDELRKFDTSYIENTHSKVLANIAQDLKCLQSEILMIRPIQQFGKATIGFTFTAKGNSYQYSYDSKKLEILQEEQI